MGAESGGLMFGIRIADESAAHYAALRDRRVPMLLSVVMTYWFHRQLCYSVLQDDVFTDVVRELIAPCHDDKEKGN